MSVSVNSATVTSFTLLVLLLPSILCHLGAALRAGTGEGKPPVLSHVRVSREPQPRILFKTDLDSGGAPLQTSKIKSPSYQHKILQFHSNGQTSSDFFPTRLYVSQLQPATKSQPVYPIASKFAKVDTRHLIGTSSSGSHSADDDGISDDSWESYSRQWEPALNPEPEEPTFTPFIGARALANMPKFFEHLRENIEALYGKGRESSSSESPESGQEDSDKSSGLAGIEQIASPTRRGYPSFSESLSHDYGNDDDLTRDYRSHSQPFTLESKLKPSRKNYPVSMHDQKTKELLQFLRGTPEFPRANNYNPSWLFTNLGLGKRARV